MTWKCHERHKSRPMTLNSHMSAHQRGMGTCHVAQLASKVLGSDVNLKKKKKANQSYLLILIKKEGGFTTWHCCLLIICLCDTMIKEYLS